MTTGKSRIIRGPREEPQLKIPGRTNLNKIKDEIIHFYRHGIKIAPHAESRPLIPLFEAAKVKLPPELKVDHEIMLYNFYLVEVTFSSKLPKDQFLTDAEFGINLTDDVKDPVRSTRAIRLFPERKDINLFTVDMEASIGIDANANISIPKSGSELLPFQKADINAKIKAELIAGPYKIQIRKAAIEVHGTSDQNIVWNYNIKSELSKANDFKSILVLKIAEEAKSVQMHTYLKVTPCKHRWKIFKDTLDPLEDKTVLTVELAKVK